MMNMDRLKDQKGVTLIVLVTIIIVILIITGISVAMLTDNNGILRNLFKARSDNTRGDDKEQIRAAYSAVKMNLMKEANGGNYTVTADKLKEQLIYDLHLDEDAQITITEVTSAEINSSINPSKQNDKVIPGGSLKITMPSTNVYIADTNGDTELMSYYTEN